MSTPLLPNNPAASDAPPTEGTSAVRTEELFHAAADLPPTARREFLDAACGADTALRQRVERLLSADATDTWFTSPAGVVPPWISPPTDDAPPAVVGTHRVIRTIGRGGSGIVYEAEQRNPKRRVAVKVLRAGFGSAAGQATRLAQEADLLGRLRHPGIAQIYEAGVAADGRPYLVMELVAERTLTAYAQAARLPTAARVRLLAAVCDAVDHAHDHRVVHLDLKPANILVDDAGRPRVLDFGIARLLETQGGGGAAAGQSAGTPAYMSPEQVAGGRPVDLRSDVYALGVILSELLGDRVPPAGSGTTALSLAGLSMAGHPWSLRRDLRAIAARATAIDPRGRYPTAAALATDLRRCLSGHPVSARQQTVSYRARRFVRRHRALTAGVVTTAAVLIAGIAASTAMAVRADAARRAADAQRQTADVYRRAAEHNLYVADVRLARDAIDAGRPDDAVRLLAEAVGGGAVGGGAAAGEAGGQGPRGWEWDFLDRLAHPPVRVFGRADFGEVRAVAVSRDGRLAASAGADNVVHVWSLDPRDAGPAAERFALRGHANGVFGLSFSPAGDRLVSTSCDGGIRLWDLTTGAALPSPPHRDAGVVGVAFGPDGRWYAAACQRRSAVVFDAATGRPLVTGEGGDDWVQDVDVTRAGDRMAVQSGFGTVTVWPVLDRDGDGLPDALGTPVVCPGHHGWTSALAVSPDGRRVASAGDGVVSVWDTTTGAEQLDIRAHDGLVLDVAWSPDGRTLVTGGRDGRICTWDAADGHLRRTYAGHGNWVFAVAYGPNGELVTGGKEGTTRVWPTGPDDGAEATRVATDSASTGVAYHPDGRRFAVAGTDGRVRVWDQGTGGPARVLTGSPDWATGVATSPDGQLLAAGGRDGTVHVWPWSPADSAADPGPPRVIAAHHDWTQAVAFSPDSTRLASGGRDRTLRLWDPRTGAAAGSVDPRGAVSGVAFSPDGRWLAWTNNASDGGVLDRVSGRRAKLTGHTQSVNGLAFSPDSRTLATASDDDTVRLSDPATGRPGPVLRGHTDVVAAVAFSPDGRRVASAGADHVVRVWEASTGRELTTARGPAQRLNAVTFSPDGNRIMAAGDEPAVFVWTARPSP